MIKFVYFDVGGVVIQDFSGTNKWEELKEEIGVNEENNARFEEVWERHENEICVSLEVDNLMPILEKEVGLKFPGNYSLLSAFVDRFKPNSSIWPVIEKIHQKCKVGLLTNMYLNMFEAIQKKGILPKIDWDVVIDSSKVGFQKPDLEIFKIAEEKTGVEGEEILFVENSPSHIETAKGFGWQTFLYESSNFQNSSQALGKFFAQAVL